MIPGVSHRKQERDIESVAQSDEARGLVGAVAVDRPDNFIGLLATTPTGRPSIRVSDVTIVWPKWRRSSSTEPASAIVSMICRTS